MSKNTSPCPICGNATNATPVTGLHLISRFDCQTCSAFYVALPETRMVAGELEQKRLRLSALLRERSLKNLPPPVLVLVDDHLAIARQNETKLPGPILSASDLLRDWPDGISERIERALCNIIRFATLGGTQVVAGKPVELPLALVSVLLMAYNEDEARYFLWAMAEYKWLSHSPRDLAGFLSLDGRKFYQIDFKPAGWTKYEELTRTNSDRNNPVFVAMWFGARNHKGEKVEQVEEMRKLFNVAILPACRATGWKCKRADTDEHNDPIIDRVIADLQIAPFVIAELTENNQGVYFEEGFARGRGTDVIYCCPKGTTPHFDVSGINLVKWQYPEDLGRRLENRILGTLGRGPHQFDASELRR